MKGSDIAIIGGVLVAAYIAIQYFGGKSLSQASNSLGSTIGTTQILLRLLLRSKQHLALRMIPLPRSIPTGMTSSLGMALFTIPISLFPGDQAIQGSILILDFIVKTGLPPGPIFKG